MSFNPFYYGEIQKYQKYFGNRKKELETEIKQDLQYFKEDYLTESIYNQNEVQTFKVGGRIV